MSTPFQPASARMNDLADYLVGRGLAEHGDFFVAGRHPDRMRSSEYIGIWELPAGGFRVWYPDNGRTKVLIETDDFEAAREVFVDESLRLARGRGRKISKESR